MKILFVANYMWDIYIFRGGLLKALIADGHEVVAVAPDNGRDVYKRQTYHCFLKNIFFISTIEKVIFCF